MPPPSTGTTSAGPASATSWHAPDATSSSTSVEAAPTARSARPLGGSGSGPGAGPAHSAIRATAGGIRLGPVAGTDQPCAGEITVTKLTAGEAPPGPWTVRLTGGDGRLTRSAQFGPGESVTFDALGGYQPGSARLGQVVGGIVYTISEPDPLGGTATVSHNPVEILTGQHEAVAVLNSYTGGGVVVPRRGGEQPTLPPGAPRPPSGPDLIGGPPGEPAADLAVTHTI